MQLTEDVLTTLGSAIVRGNSLTFPNQIERKLYEKAAAALKCVGGVWSKKAKAIVFPSDAEDVVQQMLMTGEVTNKQQEFGFFETPPAVVDRIMQIADIAAGHSVLEPSAGHGAIARRVLEIGCELDAVEILPENTAVLRQVLPGASVIEYDFLQIEPDPSYDRIVMNPPFARQADIHHVNHALRFLKPGGRLVAVMSAGVKFRSDKLTNQFRMTMLVDQQGQIKDLPEGSFKQAGTGVNTVLAWTK